LNMREQPKGPIDADAVIINEMHDALSGFAKMSLEKAIMIGGALSAVKKRVGHGKWLQWCSDHLNFVPEYANRYMRLHRERAKLGSSPNLGIAESYRAISTGKLSNADHGGNKGDYKTPDLADGVFSDFESITSLGVKFGTVYADPPWRYNNQGTRAATDNHYDGTMSVDELCDLPVGDVAAEKSHLHLWTTNAFLYETRRILDAWGFEYKSTFVWVKTQMGIGNYWRNSHELMITGVKGGLTAASRAEMSWMESRRGKHSAKPYEVRRSIERLSPGPYLELFGRRKIDNWVVFGNQIEEEML